MNGGAAAASWTWTTPAWAPPWDLWMLLSGDRRQRTGQLSALLDGYEQFRTFDRRELVLIEPCAPCA